MNSEEEIKVINKYDNISEEYKITPPQEIKENSLKELLGKQEEEKRISNIKLKEDYVIVISTKISKNILEKNTTNDKNINICGFDIKIVKLNLNKEEKKSEWKEININIPLKEAKLIPNNTLINKYFFYDFIKIDDTKSYLHIFVFGQLHIYKIYQKDGQLKYNKIELKKFNDKTKVLYLGENYKSNENILEISLLLKPMNVFMFLQISTDERYPKIEERKYEFIHKNAKNILYKFIRSYCGIFLFYEKESDNKYIIFKEEKNENQSVIKIKEAKINIKDSYNNYFYTISNKLFYITELPTEEENNNNYIVLGIFRLLLDKDKDIYYSQLIQKIKIRNEGVIKNYIINVNSLNYISIQIGEIVFFIHLDENSSVDMINKFNLNTKNLQISNIISDKSNEWSIFLSYKNSKIYLSTLYDDKNNISIGKCITNYDSTKNEDNAEEENESEEEEENCESEEKESEKEIESEDIKNGNTDNENTDGFSKNLKPKIEEYIDKIINERVKLTNEKVAKIKKEYDNKFEMIQKDIELQEKENEKLEKDVKNILALISDLQKLNHEVDEKENTNENNKQYANRNLMFKNEIMNIMQYNNLRQLNQMKMMNQYNMMNPDNFFINSQMPMNDPRLSQLFNQNRNMLNQGNFFFKKMNNNNEFH